MFSLVSSKSVLFLHLQVLCRMSRVFCVGSCSHVITFVDRVFGVVFPLLLSLKTAIFLPSTGFCRRR